MVRLPEIFSSGSTGSGSGGGTDYVDIGSNVITKLTPNFPGIDKEAISVKAFLDCFGSDEPGAKYRVDLYVRESDAGTGGLKMWFDVGHTFIGLTKTVNGVSVTQYVGFYPNRTSFIYPVTSKIVNNGNYNYSVSVGYEVSASAFYSAVSTAISKASNQYDISQYNCTNYALDICDAAGLKFPRRIVEFPYEYGNGLSPGSLGVDLKNLSITNNKINIAGGTSGTSKGPCYPEED